MLSSDLDLLSHSHVQCAQFIGLVATNRHAPHSIAENVLIAGAVSSFFFLCCPIDDHSILLFPRMTTSHLLPSHLFLFRFLSSSLLFPFVKSIFLDCFLSLISRQSRLSLQLLWVWRERKSEQGECSCWSACLMVETP